MEIKNWISFLESNYSPTEAEIILYTHSESCEESIERHKLKKNIISHYFSDLLDDGFRLYTLGHVSGPNFIPIIKLSKTFGKDEKIDKESIAKSCMESQQLLLKIENIVTKVPLVSIFPRSTTVSVKIELCDSISLSGEIRDFIESLPGKVRGIIPNLNRLLEYLKKSGIREADKLIGIHPEWENRNVIDIGFLTEDEIASIAYYNKETESMELDHPEIKSAIVRYKNGECEKIISGEFI